MSDKLLAVIFVCAFAAIEAGPASGRGQVKDGEKGRGQHSEHVHQVKPDNSATVTNQIIPHTLKALENMCNGLSSGNITNDNSSYDAVFGSLDAVCSELVAFLATQAPVPADPAAPGVPDAPVNGRRKRGAREGPAGSRRGGPGPAQSLKADRSKETDRKPQEKPFVGNQAVATLFMTCKGLERLLPNLPADTPTALTTLLTNMGGVCAEADQVRNPA